MSGTSPSPPGPPGEIYRALAALMAVPDGDFASIAEALELGAPPSRSDHAELFTLQLVPYASVYLNNDGHIGGPARERVAGFWRAIEVEAPSEPDSLAALLSLCAALTPDATRTESEAAALTHRRRALLGEHLLPWLPIYLLKARQLAHPFYRNWARLLEAVLERDTAQLQPPTDQSAHWREAAPLPAESDASLEEVVSALLAPIRSGQILTRLDLSDAARQIGVAARIGERGYMLEAMLRQRPREVLTWLTDCLRETADLYASGGLYGRPTFERYAYRAERLRRTIRLLLEAQP